MLSYNTIYYEEKPCNIEFYSASLVLYSHTATLFLRNPHAFCTFSFYSKYPAILYNSAAFVHVLFCLLRVWLFAIGRVLTWLGSLIVVGDGAVISDQLTVFEGRPGVALALVGALARSQSAGSHYPNDFISPLLMPSLDVSDSAKRRCLIYLRAQKLEDMRLSWHA